MRYTLSINQVKCQEWGLNLAQGALFDLLNQASSWAQPHLVNDEVYYWVSRNKVLDEIPVAYNKADTVYRSLKVLAEKGLIHYTKEGRKDLVKLSSKGMTWNVKGTTQGDAKLGNKSDFTQNSEINPNELGNKSDFNSEINPTDKSTSNKSTKDKKYTPKKPECVSDDVWNDLLTVRKQAKAADTKTAWAVIHSQLNKAQNKTNHSLDQIITFWITKGWRGFNCEWYLSAIQQPTNKKANSDLPAWQQTYVPPTFNANDIQRPVELSEEEKKRASEQLKKARQEFLL